MMKYLLWFANAHVNFKIPELKAIASFYKIPMKWIEKKPEAPYVILELSKEEDAINLTSRSVLVRSCYEIWGQGCTDSELDKSVLRNIPQVQCHLSKGEDFKLNIKSFNKKLTTEQKQKKINSFSYIPFQGKVNLEKPKLILTLIEYYGVNRQSIPEDPSERFFGRWLADGQREILHTFSLKRRHFIGTTSMDAELAFLMVNMAQIGPGHLVLDPFVGTGSILVSAAQRGAYVIGWDIDYLTLHAKTKPSRYKETVRKPTESVFSNLRQYGLQKQYLDILVMDSSRCTWRSGPFFDAIMTDPPYGIRESTEKVGCNKRKLNPDGQDKETEKRLPVFEEFPVHYPPKVNYETADIMADLLNFSASHLKTGGRLVYWLPVFREDYNDEMIPKHPALQLEFNSEQILSTYSSRRLITMLKIREPKKGEVTLAKDLKRIDEFRLKFSEASQNFQALSKQERRALRKALPMDKRGQGYATVSRSSSSSGASNDGEEYPVSSRENTDIQNESRIDSTLSPNSGVISGCKIDR